MIREYNPNDPKTYSTNEIVMMLDDLKNEIGVYKDCKEINISNEDYEIIKATIDNYKMHILSEFPWIP